MQWQVWTTFGIRLGYVANLELFLVDDGGGGGVIRTSNWRLMLASAMQLTVVVGQLVNGCPESLR